MGQCSPSPVVPLVFNIPAAVYIEPFTKTRRTREAAGQKIPYPQVSKNDRLISRTKVTNLLGHLCKILRTRRRRR